MSVHVFKSLTLGDALSMADIFLRRGCKVTLEMSAEGLIGKYYTLTVEGEI